MKILYGQPGTGKTRKILQESSQKNIPILTYDRARVERLKDKAVGYSLIIPEPINVEDVLKENQLKSSKVIIDREDITISKILFSLYANKLTPDLGSDKVESKDYNTVLENIIETITLSSESVGLEEVK